MAIQRQLEINGKTNKGRCLCCGGMIVPDGHTIAAKSKAEREATMCIDFVCENCGAEYHGEIGTESRKVNDRKIIIQGRTGGGNLLGSIQREVWW